MPAVPTDDDVRAFAADAVDRPVASVEGLSGSVANHNFLVRLADQSAVVVKSGPRREMTAEAWACQLLTDAGVPVPRVLTLDLEEGLCGRATLVLSFMSGAGTADPRVASQAGRWFRRVHAQHLPGWGPLVVDRSGRQSRGRGLHPSWRDAVLDELSGLPELVDAGVIEPELAVTARSRVAVDSLLSYSGPGVLLHNDLKPAHVFGQSVGGRARLSAIIDWGDARVGDPVADLARLSMSDAAMTDGFLSGYGATMSPALTDRLARYRILWNIAALTYEYRAGGDWFDVYRGSIAEDTARTM